MGELVWICGRDPTLRPGGAESYAVAMAQAAIVAGYEPQTFVLGRASRTLKTGFGTVHRVATPWRPIVSYASVFHAPILVPRIAGFLARREGPHVIHSHMGWGAVADVVARILARRGIEARTVVSLYDTVEHEQGAKASGRLVQETARLRIRYALLGGWTRCVAAPLEGRGYRASDVVLVHYENVRRLVVGAYGPHPKILNVPYCAPAALAGDIGPGVDYAREDGEPPLIVSVSRHSPRKGLDILLRALAELRDRGVVFRACLVGPGRLLSEHRALATRLGLDEIVSIPGGVQHPLEYLRACEVYVLPSTEEGSGSVSVLEALQVAAPIVASAIDGIPEDLTDEQDALLVAPGSVGELADALGRMLADAPLRERLGGAGRALYERRFTASRTAEELGRVYTALGLPPRNPAAQARS